MFYFDEDKREIRSWLRSADDKLREELRIEFQAEIRNQQKNFISAQQLAQYDAEFQSRVEVLIGNKTRENNYWVTEKIAAVQKSFDDFKANEFDILQNSSAATSEEVAALKNKVDALKISAAPSSGELDTLQKSFDDFKANEFDALKNSAAATSEEVAALKNKVDALPVQTPSEEISALSAENDALKKQVAQQTQNFDSLKNAVAKALTDIQKNFFGLLQQRDAQISALQNSNDEQDRQIAALKKEIADLKTQSSAEIVSLKDALAALTKRVEKLEPPPEPDDDEKFFLPEQSKEFLPADAKKISSKVKEALNLSDVEKFLSANSSTTTKQFQKLIAAHLKEVKKFVDRLKLNDLDDSEVSEAVTAKFFKLFHRTIFDNILIAIRRGLKTSDADAKKFYSDFLSKLNEYLTRCGIYSLNVKGNRPAESDDYENMTPQILKTGDENLSGKIESIDRLPYRINYLDEFGEEKFFQYAGTMNLYKAV